MPHDARIPARPNPELRFVSRSELRSALSVGSAADALADGLLRRHAAAMEDIPRTVVPVASLVANGSGEMLLMPAFGPEGAGLKLVAIAHDNPARKLPLVQGLYVLLERDSLAPEFVLDGRGLTELRTAAVSVLATRHLGRPDSRRLVVFGAGPQANAHVDAMRAALPIEHITIVPRSRACRRAAALVERLRKSRIEATMDGPEAVKHADVICTCTTSRTPVFNDRDLPAGVHINAIGAYRVDMCEIPAASLSRALLVVENVEAALAEAGDVVQAIASGALAAEGFARELHEVLGGVVSRASHEQVTIFKSVGVSAEDLIVARAIAEALPKE